jgi:hypothetical protein
MQTDWPAVCRQAVTLETEVGCDFSARRSGGLVFPFSGVCPRPVFPSPTKTNRNPVFGDPWQAPHVKPPTTTEKKQKKNRKKTEKTNRQKTEKKHKKNRRPICRQKKNTSEKKRKQEENGKQKKNTTLQRGRPLKQEKNSEHAHVCTTEY